MSEFIEMIRAGRAMLKTVDAIDAVITDGAEPLPRDTARHVVDCCRRCLAAALDLAETCRDAQVAVEANARTATAIGLALVATGDQPN
jgi:hypothetical protein